MRNKTKTLKVCFINCESSDHLKSIRSLESDFSKLMEKYGNQDFDFFLITKENPHLENKLSDFNIIRMEKYLKYANKNTIFSLFFPLFFNLKNFIKDHNFDIVIGHDFKTGYLACKISRLNNSKLLITLHGYVFEELKSKLIRTKNPALAFITLYKLVLQHLFFRYCKKHCDLFVLNDPTMKSYYSKRGLENKKMYLREVSVDIDMFSNIDKHKLNEFKEKYGLDKNYVTFVGELNHRDGIKTFIEFIKYHNKNLNYLIVGEGEKIDYVENFIKFSNNVSFIKNVGYEEMPYIYSISSFVVLPMNSPQAGIGRITIEAMASKTPVLIKNIAPFNKILTDNIHVLFFNEDLESISECFKTIDNNPSLIDSITGNAFLLVESKYSKEAYIKNWINSLDKLYK